MFIILWFQHLSSRLLGYTFRRAAHSPKAPSPTTAFGQASPRSLRLLKRQDQLSVDSLCPEERARIFLVPSERAATITRRQDLSFSRPALIYTPSAQM